MNICPISYQSQVANQNRIGFNTEKLSMHGGISQGLARYGSRMPSTGAGLILERGRGKKIFPNTVNDDCVESLEQRIAEIRDKVHALTTRYDENKKYTGLGSNYLLRNCNLPIYTTKRFENDTRDIIAKKYSDLTPQSMPILEKFVNNEAFYENKVLCFHIIDAIIDGFVDKYNVFNGMKFKDDIDERASKINMVMDAYLNSPEAQQNEFLQENIAYMMARAGEAPIAPVEQAVFLISNPDLWNKSAIDEVLYNMNPQSHFENISKQPEKLRERIENASRQIDKVPRIRFYKACFKRNDYNINSINLPLVEKFLENTEFNQNDKWLENLPHLIYKINEYLSDYSIRAAANKTKVFINIMDDYLKDENAQKDPQFAKSYFDRLLSDW